MKIAPANIAADLFRNIQDFWSNIPELTAKTPDWAAILGLMDQNGEIDCSKWAHSWFNALRSNSNLTDDQKTLIASTVEKTLTNHGWVLKVNGTPADFSDTALGKNNCTCTAGDKCTLAPVVAAQAP